MTAGPGLYESVAELCVQAESLAAGTQREDPAREIAGRLGGPLRVAIAGRVKAGKSTLLNALVGERLAPTDAGECTGVLSWYQRGRGYGVGARLTDGTLRPLEFRRGDGALEISLAPLSADDVKRLEVEWPSSRLEGLTLIDTPGIGSLDRATSARTEDLFAPHDGGSDVDAVSYLMRHLHRHDAEFLQAFADPATRASPANAVAVLSRADEVGVVRPDALESARRIVSRYALDEQLRPLVGAVLPIAGLAAETGMTLREEEAESLQSLAGLEGETIDAMLLSVDLSVLRPALRQPLLRRAPRAADRLDLFGVRFAIEGFRSGRIRTAVGGGRLRSPLSGLYLIWSPSPRLVRQSFGRPWGPDAAELKLPEPLVAPPPELPEL